MPTQKQITAAEKMVENVGAGNPKSTGQILRESGYSPAIAKNPVRVIKSKGFTDLLEDAGVTDDKLTEILNDGLGAMTYVKTEKVTGIGKTRVKTEEIKAVPNDMIRHKYLETALKLKGHGTGDGAPTGNTYHTFIQQNNINPNAPEAKQMVDESLEILMAKTKRAT